jgi:hypothetical protein
LPYIPKHSRPVVAQGGATNPGELNFELTLAIRAYLRESGELKYAHINHVVECLEWVKAAILSAGPVFETAVELRTQLYHTADRYISRAQSYMMTVEYRERHFNAQREAIGALECCKLEFYRRVAVPYEDRKIKSNGDVYT